MKPPERASLYDLADKLYRLGPWNWMREDQIIGLRHPKTGEMGYMSVMGASGIHHTLAVYLGEEPLHRFNLIQEAGYQGLALRREDMMALVLESRQVQMNFARRDELFASELAEIMELGRKYRKENWPCFRSFRPGYAPARANEEELRWLALAGEQILAVAPLLENDLFGDSRGGEANLEHMTREQADGEWRTVWQPRDQRLYEFPRPAPDAALVKKVAALKPRLTIECQFQIEPTPIGSEEAAKFPYLMLSVDRDSGFVFGTEMLNLKSMSLEEVYAVAPDRFLRQWQRNGLRPDAIHVTTATAHALLEKTAKALKVPLRLVAELPTLDEALVSLRDFMRSGRLG